MGFFERVFDNASPSSFATRMRRARFACFTARLDRLVPPLRILDVGGRQIFWERMGFVGRAGVEVTLLNLEPIEARLPGFSAVAGDARAMAGFADGSFDVVFSNSVIEHLGTFADQRRMADEVMRVGRRYFVQTPNRHFLLEPHFLVPGFQFLPRPLQVAMVRRLNLGWYRRRPEPAEALALVAEHRLLTLRELRALFPGAEILRERVLGLTKSFIACGGWQEP
jgi:hypothetical protein